MQRHLLIVVGVVMVVAAGLRLWGAGTFMTADEENWMIRSGQYWHDVVRDGKPDGAFVTTHPGATLMWIAGSGIFLQEARLGFEIDTSNLIFFRKAALYPVVVSQVLLLGLVTWLVGRLASWREAALGGLLLAVQPYLVGMGQVVHLDALLGLFMLIAVLSLLHVYTRLSQQWDRQAVFYLVLSGVATGLALATKMLPALWLFVTATLIVIGSNLWQRQSWRLVAVTKIRTLGFILGVALLTFWVAWPALWTKPDAYRAFEEDVPIIITDEHVALEVAEEPIAPASFYARTLLGRLTSLELLLLLPVIMVAVWWRERRVLWLTIYALGFLFLITYVAKKGDRYAVPALQTIPLVVGWILAVIWQRLEGQYPTRVRWFQLGVLLSGVGILVIPFLWAPYTIAYNNVLFPNVRPLSQQGWGEGLDAAARWLNERGRASTTYIASWYPGVTATFYQGRVMSLSAREDYRVAYVVTYRNMGGRAPDDIASDVLDEFRDQEPIHTIEIMGKPYAWIYETLSVGNFTKHIGEIVGSREIGQTVRPEVDIWSSIDIGFATFSGRSNTEDVIVHIRESSEAATDLRTIRVNARDIIDNEWHRFSFEPITGARGEEFYIGITSPTSVAGNAVTVRYIDADVRPGQLMVNGELREGDMAYQIGEE